MKKPVIAALCCLLALGTATAAFAEEPTPTPAPELVELSPEETAPQFYPDSISWQEDGGQLLVVKQYSVPYGTAVTDLTESGMQWDGSDYTLWGVTQSVEGGVTEEKEVTQDFELSVRSADAETARNDVKESVAYDDEYGFSGSLTLQDITIGETLQADSTYMATAHYAGTVTRTEAGTVHYTLLYAPVSAPVVAATAESGITPALLIMGIAALCSLSRYYLLSPICCAKSLHTWQNLQSPPPRRKSMCRPGILSSAAEMRMKMKKISDWAKVLLPLVGSGMVLHYLFLWHERRHAVALHKEIYHKPKY